jgi:hypothetical protein
VDLMRHALGLPAETTAPASAGAVLGATVLGFALAVLLFDPERRFFPAGPTRAGSPGEAHDAG